MHEIAETGTSAFAHLVLTTTSFTKISYWREFSIDWTTAEPTIVQVFGSFFRIFFTAKLRQTKTINQTRCIIVYAIRIIIENSIAP